jgi:Ca2+:H+ antiporter
VYRRASYTRLQSKLLKQAKRPDTQHLVLLMLLFIPACFAGYWLKWDALLVFILSGLAIIPLASIIASATETIADKVGAALGGLLNATFGNATEMIIALVALSSGLVDLVKASISGTIVANLLLAMGMAIFAGGLRFSEQHFNQRVARINASSLNLALVVMLAPTAIRFTSSSTDHPGWLDGFSLIASILLLTYYLLTLLFSIKTHRTLYETGAISEQTQQRIAPVYSGSHLLVRPILSLLVASIVLALVSEVLVHSLEETVHELHLTQLFTGVILIPLFGGMVEYLTAIRFARNNKIDLAIAVATGSSQQIAMFVAPLLVIIGGLWGQPMNLEFHPFELVAIAVAVLITNSISHDGRSNWLEGVLLLMVYAVVGTAFYFHP